MSNQILIVEDELKLASLLVDYFSLEQFTSHCIHDGNDVIEWVKKNNPNAILLDLMLPNKDGMQICRELRQFTQVPILMITAKVEEIDRLIGLELGADDYICKPFSPREVVARVKAVLRRTQFNQPSFKSSSSLELDESRYQVNYHGKSLDLTAVEFQLLKPLCAEPGRLFTREQLMQNMYEDNRIVSDRTIDSDIKKLRKKIHQLSPDEELIHSVYGVGYRLLLNEKAN
jgi:two-component system, OmpR family, response regulator BaeR